MHRIVLAALVVASKACDDVFHSNSFMSRCGGIGVAELCKLEVELVHQLGWGLLPTADELHELRAALAEGRTAAFWSCFLSDDAAARAEAAAEAAAAAAAAAALRVSPVPPAVLPADTPPTPRQPTLRHAQSHEGALWSLGRLPRGAFGRLFGGRSASAAAELDRLGDSAPLEPPEPVSPVVLADASTRPASPASPETRLGGEYEERTSPRSVTSKYFALSSLLPKSLPSWAARASPSKPRHAPALEAWSRRR